jgi:tetraacyldisaccharide 4'-kinase
LQTTSIFDEKIKYEITENTHILLVSGIADSKQLYEYLLQKSKNITELKFKDHHSWNKHDFVKIKNKFNKIQNNNKIIITTEKDAVRFVDNKNIDILQNLPVFYIPIEVKFLNLEQEQKFLKQLFDYVEKNRRSHKLY